MSTCASMVAIAKVYSQLSQLRRLLRCEKDSLCSVEWLPSLLEFSAREALNMGYDLAGTKEVIKSCKLFKKQLKLFLQQERWAVLQRRLVCFPC